MNVPIIYEATGRKSKSKRYFFDEKRKYNEGDLIHSAWWTNSPERFVITGVDVKGFNFKRSTN